MKFFAWVRKTVGGMVTEHDNQTHSLIKHGGWVGLSAVIGLACHQEMIKSGSVSVKDLAQSITLVVVGVGGGVALGKGGEHEVDR